MIHHNIQQQIVYKLARVKSANYSALKPDNMESNAFNYHLKEVIKNGYVVKGKDGDYTLTHLGMRVGLNAHLTLNDRLSLSHAVIFLALHDKTKGWLLRKRTAHPMYGYVGFIHGEPLAHETVYESATRCFQRVTGLTADFTPRGFGYTKFFTDGELESFNNFTLLIADSYTGELIDSSETGKNVWLTEKELFKEEKVFSNMKPIFEAMKNKELFFVDIRDDT
jgi:hypothetical protein